MPPARRSRMTTRTTCARTSAPAVSVVVPVRNEADNIAPAGRRDRGRARRPLRFEIIYVNDGSTDAHRSRADRARRRSGRGCGRSGTRRRAASRRRCAAACARARAPSSSTLDGDGQNDPAFIPALLEALEAAAPRVGLVAGQRVGRKDTGFKKLQSRIANGVRGAMLRDGTRDTGCGLKAFRRDVFLALPYFDGLHRFLPALVRREGYDDRLCRCGRPAAPCRRVELRHVGPALGRHPRSRRRVVADPPQAARAGSFGGIR